MIANPHRRSSFARSGLPLALCCWLAACAAPAGRAPTLAPAADAAGAPHETGTGGAAAGAPVSRQGVVPLPAADLSVMRPETRSRYRELQGGSGRVWLLDPARSDIRIYVFRAGLAARLGHNHLLAVPRFSGLAWSPAKGVQGTRADFGFRLSDLQVDPPAMRAETGGGFASALDADAIRGTYEHLLSERGLDAASHPWVEASATLEAGELPVVVADFALSLHGETHHQRVVLRLQLDDRHLEASGTLALRQGDFGIKPYSAAGGLLAVDDVLAVEFHLRGAPLAGAIP